MVKIYTKNNCPQCKMAKRVMIEQDTDFEEVNIDEKPEYVNFLKDELNFKSVPVIEHSGGYIVGFVPKEIRALPKKET